MHPLHARAIHRALWGVLAVCMLCVTPVRAQGPGCPELAEAQQRYDNGRFEEAIAIATRCLDGEAATEAERQRAYRLVGLSYIGQDLRDNAREAVRQLVMLVPNFEPDPVNDPPQFIQMVEEAKAARDAMVETEEPGVEEPADEVALIDAARRAEEERQAEEQRRREEEARQRAEANRREGGGGITKWLLIGGAVVGGGALAAVLLSGGGDGNGGGGGGIAPPPPLPGN